MKRTFILLFTLLYFPSILFALDNEKVINDLKKMYKKELPNSFFIIQANTLLPVFTQAPQIIERIEEIRKHQLCPYIFMIWKDEAGIGKHFFKYLKENYYIDTNDFVQAYIAPELYDQLGNNVNTTIHYFYNLKHFRKIDGKYERFTELLPYDLISIKFDNKYLLEDDSLYHTNQVNYYPINDTFAIELFDGHYDRVRLTNILNGKVLKIFNTDQINHIDLFNKFMNYLKLSEDELHKNNDYLNKIKRTPLRIDNAYIKSINEIYLIGTAQISYRTPEVRYIPGEFKSESIIVKQGDYITEDFGIIIKTDSSFKINDTKFINTFSNSEYNKNNFVDPTGGFYLKEGKYFLFGYNYCKNKDKTYKEFFKRNNSTQFIHTFSSDNINLVFENKGEAKLVRPLGKYYFYQEGIYLFGTKQHIYAIMNLFPEIYSYNNTNPVQKISKNIYNYSFRQNSYDTTTIESIPFYCFYPGYIIDHNVLAIFYRSDENFFLKFFDSKLNMIQELNVTDMLHLKDEMKSLYFYSNMAIISDNFLNIIFCNQDGCYNYRYQLSVEPFNSIYFARIDKFLR